MQHFTYTHWLPKILGPRGMSMLGPYTGYKSDVNPAIANEFAVAALRFGHTLVQPVIFRLNETFHEVCYILTLQLLSIYSQYSYFQTGVTEQNITFL